MKTCAILIASMLVFFSGDSARTQETDIYFSPSILQHRKICEFLLLNHPRLMEKVSVMNVGLFKELRLLLEELKIPRAHVELTLTAINQLLKTDTPLPFFRLVDQYLKESDRLPQFLAVCAGDSGCELNEKLFPPALSSSGEAIPVQAAWTSLRGPKENFYIAHGAVGFPITSQKAREILETFDGLSRYEILFLRGVDLFPLDSYSRSEMYRIWLTDVIGELSYYAATTHLSDWITANLKLLARGRRADLLFKLYVRVDDDANIIIQNSFLESHLLSVGGNVKSIVSALLSPLRFAESQYQLQARTYHELKGRLGELTLKDMGITEDNIFHLAWDNYQIMHGSIRASGN